MRDMMLMAGLCSVVAISLGACGSDVEENPTSASSSATTGGNGGMGGAGGAPNSSSSISSSSTGGAGSLCDQACDKIAVECGLGQICDMPPVNSVLDCDDPASDCPGQCILDADCGAIISLASQNPDPTLAGCLSGCQGQGGAGGGSQDCLGCVQGACLSELGTCAGDAQCSQLGQCVAGCNGDAMCSQACLDSAGMLSPASAALLSCASANCETQCGLSAGTGGAGGN